MSQGVRGKRLVQATVSGMALDEIPEHWPRHACAARGDKHRVAHLIIQQRGRASAK